MLIHAGKGSRSFGRPDAIRQTTTIPNILPSAASHSTNRLSALGDQSCTPGQQTGPPTSAVLIAPKHVAWPLRNPRRPPCSTRGTRSVFRPGAQSSPKSRNMRTAHVGLCNSLAGRALVWARQGEWQAAVQEADALAKEAELTGGNYYVAWLCLLKDRRDFKQLLEEPRKAQATPDR